LNIRTHVLPILTSGLMTVVFSHSVQADPQPETIRQAQNSYTLELEKEAQKECRNEYHLWTFGKSQQLIEECIQSLVGPTSDEDSQG